MKRKTVIVPILLFFLLLVTQNVIAGTPNLNWTDFQFRFDTNYGAMAAEETDITVVGDTNVILAIRFTNSGAGVARNNEYGIEWRESTAGWFGVVVTGGTANMNGQPAGYTEPTIPINGGEGIWSTDNYNTAEEDTDGAGTDDYLNSGTISAFDNSPQEWAEMWFAIEVKEQASPVTYDIRPAVTDGSDTFVQIFQTYGPTQASITVNPSPSNAIPDLNVWQVEGWDFNAALPSFSYAVDGNLQMNFRTSDAEGTQDLNFNMWYDTTRGGKTNKIIQDVNLSTNTAFGNCDTNDKITGMSCFWDWNISGIADNNYWITIEINDGVYADANTASAERSFRVNPSADSCTCPASGDWQISGADVCTLTNECNLTGGGLHIANGSLNITSTGTLNIPTGYGFTLDETTNSSLFVQSGGKAVVHQ
jgi:hypothetical protein